MIRIWKQSRMDDESKNIKITNIDSKKRKNGELNGNGRKKKTKTTLEKTRMRDSECE